MTDPDHDHVHFNRVHSGAVREEMGERLSVVLRPQSSELPPALLALIEQLAQEEIYKGAQDCFGA